MKLLPDVNITRLKGVEKQLERIANALDRLILEQYGVPMQATPSPKDGDDSDVLYTDDRQQFVQELKDIAAMKPIDRTVDVDDEDLR